MRQMAPLTGERRTVESGGGGGGARGRCLCQLSTCLLEILCFGFGNLTRAPLLEKTHEHVQRRVGSPLHNQGLLLLRILLLRILLLLLLLLGQGDHVSSLPFPPVATRWVLPLSSRRMRVAIAHSCRG
jgi:hypothetical protein